MNFVQIPITQAGGGILLVASFRNFPFPADKQHMINPDGKFECLDDFPGLHWISGEGGRGISVGAGLCDYTGIEPQRFVADWLAMIHPDDRSVPAEENGLPVRPRLRMRRFDGSYRMFETRSRSR